MCLRRPERSEESSEDEERREGTSESIEEEPEPEDNSEPGNLFFKSVKSHLVDYCESTSVHGFAYLVDTRHCCEGLFGALILSVGLTLAGIIIHDSLR